MRPIHLLLALMLAACGDDSAATTSGTGAGGTGSVGSGSGGSGSGGDPGAGGGLLATVGSTGAGGGDDGVVWGNSPDALYRIDPITFEATRVGTFDCVTVVDPDDSSAGMLDIAVDEDGNMVGWGSILESDQGHGLFTIDPATAHCTPVQIHPEGGAVPRMAGLSFVPASLLGASEGGLFSYDYGGGYFRVDRDTGDVEQVGVASIASKSPDLVSIEGDGTYVFDDDGQLARIDGANGDFLEVVGGSCVDCAWGMAYWGGRVFGFAIDGSVTLVDSETGATESVTLTGDVIEHGFRGGCVTPFAPLEIPN
jgi:hypothetical protein